MKITRIVTVMMVFLAFSIVWGAEKRKPLWFMHTDPGYGIEYQIIEMPGWAVKRAEKLDFDKKYDLSFYLNPFYLTVDFDNDNRMDVAVWVKERSTGKKGVAIFIRSQEGILLAGAGKKLGLGDGDYSWAGFWLPLDKNEIVKSHWEKHPPGNVGQGIYLCQFETSSGAIYWNGKALEWYQVSD